MVGFEPTNEGVKVPCLAAWLHPYNGKKGIGKNPNPFFLLGWVKGLEPSTPGTTIRCSNQLSYTHHIYILGIDNIFLRRVNGTPGGTRTPGLLLRRQLLYPPELLAHISRQKTGAGDGNRTHVPSLEGWCTSRCATPASKAQQCGLVIVPHVHPFVNSFFKKY